MAYDAATAAVTAAVAIAATTNVTVANAIAIVISITNAIAIVIAIDKDGSEPQFQISVASLLKFSIAVVLELFEE